MTLNRIRGRRESASFFWRLFLVFLLLSSGAISQAATSPSQLDIEWTAIGFAEPVSVYEYAHDWDDHLESGSDAFFYERRSIGFTYKGFHVAQVSQRIYEADANRDTAELYHRVKNKLPLPVGDVYKLDLNLEHYSTRGVQLGYEFNLAEQWQILPKINFLKTYGYVDGRLNGRAEAVATKEYEYQLFLNNSYSSDPLLERQVDMPDGHGLSFDLEMNYQFGESWRFSFLAQDLISRLEWDRSPRTVGELNNAIRSFDEDGFLEFKPALTGREDFTGHDSNLPYRVKLQADYQKLRWGGNVSVILTPLSHFFELGGRYSSLAGFDVQLFLLPQELAVGAGVDWHGLRLKIVSDSMDFKAARYFQFALGYQLAF